MNIKKKDVKLLSQVLSTVNPDSLSKPVRIAINRNFIAGRRIMREIEELHEDVSAKLVTAEFKELSAKEVRTPEEQAQLNTVANGINAEFAAIMTPILDENCEINIVKMSETLFNEFIDTCQNLEYAQYGFLYDYLCDGSFDPAVSAESKDSK